MKSRNRKSAIENRQSPDPRHVPVREEILRVYARENNGRSCPWSAKHAKILQTLLLSVKNWNVSDFHTAILHRFASEGVVASEDPALWMGKLFSYRAQPLNKFNKTRPLPDACLTKLEELYADYAEVNREDPGSGIQDSARTPKPESLF